MALSDDIQGNSLFDALAGAATGTPTNRAGLQSYAVNGQVMNGLHTAQTDEAIGKAKAEKVKAQALSNIGAHVAALTGNQALGDVTQDFSQGGMGTADQVAKAPGDLQQFGFHQQIADPNATPEQRVLAQQGIKGEIAGPIAVHPEYVNPNDPTTVHQTPLGTAQTHANESLGNLRQTQSDVGGFNPNQKGGGLNLADDDFANITQAAKEGRVDIRNINSRNAPIYAATLRNNPGINLNQLHADAALQSNATFHQRAMTVDALPEIIGNVAAAGKKIDFANPRILGDMQAWMLGQNNDPNMTDYMTQRNDALMTIAGVMRGVGMSDKAHQAEIEAMHPSLPPSALDGWVNGQMKAVNARQRQMHKASNIGGAGGVQDTSMPVSPQNPAAVQPPAGGPPAAAPTAAAPTATIPPAAAASLSQGHITTFGNGQKWTIGPDGKPKQVQ